MSTVINFYRANELPYGVFSNFDTWHPIRINGKEYPTTEHYFQAMKFEGTPYAEEIRQAKTPGEAAKLGRSRTYALRSDWEEVKDDVMHTALFNKFMSYPSLQTILKETGDTTLVEHTVNDSYWGDGGDGSGLNKLGELLMRLRSIL